MPALVAALRAGDARARCSAARRWRRGRCRVPEIEPVALARARALATHRDDHALLPLPVLALLIGVHVKTLRAAARDGRLPVTYDTRTTFRRLRARATPAAARAFRRSYYGRPVKPVDRRAPLTWASVPDDYDEQIRALRRARGLSQARLATLVGAARKAVVYQWEARKRTPSPVFWQRITALHVPVSIRAPTPREDVRESHRERARNTHERPFDAAQLFVTLRHSVVVPCSVSGIVRLPQAPPDRIEIEPAGCP